MFRVFQHRTSGTHFVELFADGVLCFIAALLSAATLAHPSPGVSPLLQVISPAILFSAFSFALVMALLYSFVGLYRHRNLGLVPMFLRIGFAFVVGGYITYLTIKYIRYEGYASSLVGYSLVYLMGGLTIYRGAAWGIRQLVGTRRVLIVGTGPDAHQVCTDLRAGGHWAGYDVVGFFPTAEQTDRVALRGAAHIFDTRLRMVDLVREHKISEIIVAVREQRGGGVPMDQLLECRIGGVPIMDLAYFYKRVFDVVSSSLLLLLGAPIMVLTALAIRMDSVGPILYRQERVGLGGQGFSCIKFRSMRTDAEKDGVARWASKNDSRITRVGAFIRKTRIDELPQLFSVLKGEMSMVGPRPERPSFVAQLREQIPFYDLRHTVKPGLTGWAQVRYAYGASLEDARKKHQFDLYYVKNNSLLLDLQVLIETVSVVLFREGAH
jgi:lipopolysaccharide/colanic/teichoic acid biosynthesis glycosyltransferase